MYQSRIAIFFLLLVSIFLLIPSFFIDLFYEQIVFAACELTRLLKMSLVKAKQQATQMDEHPNAKANEEK